MLIVVVMSVTQIWFHHVRLKHKFNTKSKRPKVMERRVFEAVTKPILPEEIPYMKFSCRDPKMAQLEEENPYEQFLIRQLRKTVEHNKTILICHRQPCSSVRLREVKIDFKLKNIYLYILNNTHMREVIENTEKANLSYLLTGQNIMLTAEDVKLKEMWNILRKTPELIPLGGFVVDRLFTKNQLMAWSKLPALESQLGELVSILNLVGGGKTSSLLTSHQQTLSANLQQYHKQKSEES